MTSNRTSRLIGVQTSQSREVSSVRMKKVTEHEGMDSRHGVTKHWSRFLLPLVVMIAIVFSVTVVAIPMLIVRFLVTTHTVMAIGVGMDAIQ